MHIKARVIESLPIVDLHGRLDAHQVPSLDKTLTEMAAKSNRVLLNLSAVNFIDTSGLAILVKWVKRLREEGGDLALCGLQQPVRIIFELTRLERAFAIYPNEEKALAVLMSAVVA